MPCPFVQHSGQALCQRNPPYGFRPLCRQPRGTSALRAFRDPPTCRYASCAVVGSSGNLIGSGLGSDIDRKDAVFRINLAPTPEHPALFNATRWRLDIGTRTTWRVLTMEVYAYLPSYPRNWLAPPQGHGAHRDMANVPSAPRYAVSCHQPGATMGRCRLERLEQMFGHVDSVSHLIDPLLMHNTSTDYFRGVRHQRTLSTGMTAIALARRMCDEVHVYGFGNGSCMNLCYHYYECGPTATRQGHFMRRRASRGYHNFGAQARVLRRMASTGEIRAHWGTCDASPVIKVPSKTMARNDTRR